MFQYYFSMGFRSLRRNPILTLLLILILGIGVGASMSTWTVLHVMSGDPIPHKSARLFVPRFDYTPLDRSGPSKPETLMAYRDALALLERAPGVRRSVHFPVHLPLESERKDLPLQMVHGLAIGGDFFSIFEVPFLFGAAWDQKAKNTPDVVVISRECSERIFGKDNPVGKHLRLHGIDFEVLGVTDKWDPLPRYYNLVGTSAFGKDEEFYIPFQTAVRHEIGTSGNLKTMQSVAAGYQNMLDSDAMWLQFWIEAKSPADRAEIEEFLRNYVTEQKKLGRFERPINNRLDNVMQWMSQLGVVAKDRELSVWLAFGFLAVCLFNAVGLLLAKFAARAPEVGVRRALGAARSEIFWQFLIETGVIGLVGGVIGLGLSFGGLWLISRQSSEMEVVAHMDLKMLACTFVLSLGTSILAGLFPAWHACQVAPALQLKSQ